MTPPSRRIPALDGLRAISIGLVLISHLARTHYFPHVRVLASLGNFGVRIFFVISGYLITTLLLNEKARTGSISLQNFYMRRIFRIFPAAYAYVAVIALLSLSVITLHRGDLLYAITYTYNFNRQPSWDLHHLWSLCVEEQFYLLWPAALAMVGRRRGLRVCGLVMLICPLLRVLVFNYLPSWRTMIWETFPTTADALAAGCVLALQRGWLWEQNWYKRMQESGAFVLIPVLALAGTLVPSPSWVAFVIALPLMNIAIALTIDHCISYPEGAATRFLDRKSMAFVGVLSYSLYLWQQPFMNPHRGQSLWFVFPFNLALTLGCALLSYKLIEQPFLRLKDKLGNANWFPPSTAGNIRSRNWNQPSLQDCDDMYRAPGFEARPNG